MNESFVPVEVVDYDESLIKYYGKHGYKPSIRGNPIRFGFKMRLKCSDGYFVNVVPYQGKQPSVIEKYEYLIGKCIALFIRMINKLPNKKYPYKFYFHILFTRINLLNYLRKNGYGGPAT